MVPWNETPTATVTGFIVDADGRVAESCRRLSVFPRAGPRLAWSVFADGDAALTAMARASADGDPFALAVLVEGAAEAPTVAAIGDRIRRLDPELEVVIVGAAAAASADDPALRIHHWQPPIDPGRFGPFVRALFEKARARRWVLQTEVRIGRLLVAAPVVLYIRRPAGDHRLRFVSENARDYLGRDANDFLGRPALWSDSIHPGDRARVVRRFACLGEMNELGIEYRFRRPDNTYLWVHDRARLIRDETGAPVEIVGSWTDVTERHFAEEQIRHLAYYDDLTGLPNRTLMKELLEHAIALAARYGRRLAVMSLDVDHFKRIVDTFGHEAGDQLLNQLSKRLVASVRASDQIFRRQLPDRDVGEDAEVAQSVARLGGDEFEIILSEVRGPEDAAAAARRVHAALTSPISLGNEDVTVSVSIGIANYPNDGTTAEILLRNADTALHSAKENGRNCFRFYTRKLNERTARRFSIETRLRHALEGDEFVLHYQPIIDLQRATVRGAEALIRWQQPDEGLIPPAEFIPVAEETGLIIPISEWVFAEACARMARWRAAGLPLSMISVNVSSVQFSQRTLADAVVKALDSSRLDPACVELELTEGILISDVEASRRILERLRELGVHVCIDDFGTGYSSLAYLKSFPLSALKVPRCFIHDLTLDLSDAAIVGATVALGHNLGLQVVAEGVETREQLGILQRFQTDFVQGFLFSKAVPPDDFLAWIGRWPEISRRIPENWGGSPGADRDIQPALNF